MPRAVQPSRHTLLNPGLLDRSATATRWPDVRPSIDTLRRIILVGKWSLVLPIWPRTLMVVKLGLAERLKAIPSENELEPASDDLTHSTFGALPTVRLTGAVMVRAIARVSVLGQDVATRTMGDVTRGHRLTGSRASFTNLMTITRTDSITESIPSLTKKPSPTAARPGRPTGNGHPYLRGEPATLSYHNSPLRYELMSDHGAAAYSRI